MNLDIKITKTIKIPSKSSFEDLTIEEIGLMIEADSSISKNGNESFSSSALDDFLHNTVLKRTELAELQSSILENIYIDVPGSNSKEINVKYLKALAAKLKQED